MADVSEEADSAGLSRLQMAMAETDRLSDIHAYDGIASLLIAVVDELRQIKEILKRQPGDA